MSYFINYQKILKRIEEKARAKSKKHGSVSTNDVYVMDGGSIRIYTPGNVYLESMRVDNKVRN